MNKNSSLPEITSPFHLDRLAEQADCGLLIFKNDSNTTLIYANPFFYTLLGYTQEEYSKKYGSQFISCIHPEDSQKFKSAMARQFAMGSILHFEFRAFRKDGSPIWILLRGRLHTDEPYPCYYCSCLDITDSKLSYENLSKAKTELDTIANNLAGGILKVRLSDYKILYANDGFYRLSGLSRAEYDKKYNNICLGVLHPDCIAEVRQKVKTAVETRSPFSLEYRIIHKSGQIRWSYLKGSLIEEKENAPIYLCVIVDITRLKNYEEQLMDTQNKQQLLNQYTNEINWEYDIGADTLLRNGKTDTSFSPASTLTGLSSLFSAQDIMHPEDVEKFKGFIDSGKSGHTYSKLKARLKNNMGSYSWYLFQGVTQYDSQGHAVRMVGKTTLLDSPSDSAAAHSSQRHNPMARYISLADLETYANNMLSNPSRTANPALYVVSLQGSDVIKEQYGSRLYHSILNEIASIIDGSFSTAIKCFTTENEFLIFTMKALSPDRVQKRVLKLKNFIHAAFYDTHNTAPIWCNVCGYMADSTIKDFSELYKQTIKTLDYTAVVPVPLTSLVVSGSPAKREEQGISFLLDTFKLLEKAEENPASIKLALSNICNFFNADQVLVVEKAMDGRQGLNTYDWFVPGSPEKVNVLSSCTYDAIQNYQYLFNEDGIFICPDLSAIRETCPAIYEEFSSSCVQTLLGAGLYDSGVFSGFLSINYCTTSHIWVPQEIECLKVLGHLIGTALIKLKHTKSRVSTAIYDPITGLIDFAGFVESANKLLQTENDNNYALIYLDINNFLELNTKYGFTTGNKILKYLSNSILHNLGTDELCSRVQGDHFLIFMKYKERNDVNNRLAQFNEYRIKQMNSLGNYYRFSLACGIYQVQPEDDDITSVVDKADFARKTVKQMSGSYNFAFYSKAMEQWQKKEKELVFSLTTAFENQEFVPFYQPTYNMNGESLESLEALARWKRPSSSRILYPPEFLPLLEYNKQVIELDFYMVEAVCRQLRIWLNQRETALAKNMPSQSKKVVPVSINISGAHLNSVDFVDRLIAITDKYQISPQYLILEFAESLFIREPEPLNSLLMDLAEHGFSITVDGFGEEFSSINLFKKFPITAIKFDTNFFQDKMAQKKDLLIIKKIIEMAKVLDIKVLSENVETSFQADLLRDIGCEAVQGFLYHRPMPVDELEKYVL